MKTQIIENINGTEAGVFIPIEYWNNIKRHFPNIEKVNEDIPQWQKDLLDKRLNEIDSREMIQPIEKLFQILDEEV